MSAQINVKIEKDLKQDVDNILHQLGLSTTDAVRIFFKKIKLTNGLPFDMVLDQRHELKSSVKKQILTEEKNIDKLPHFKTTEDMFEHLGITNYKR